MAVHFHPLTVKKVHKETPDCIVITFDIPGEMNERFTFQHGQNVTLRKLINGEEIRRSYSICSAPNENCLRVAVKKVQGGKFSTFVNDYLQVGDSIDVMPPTGRFTSAWLQVTKKLPYAFAAGSGITPLLSIIKTTLLTELQSTFTLIYGNRNRASIIFFEELAGLKNKYVERFIIFNILSGEKSESSVNFGRINAAKLLELQKLVDYKNVDEAFICGPQEMILSVSEFLQNSGVPQKKIHFELFTVPGSQATSARAIASPDDGKEKSKITIQLDGRNFNFDLAFNSHSILDAALTQGADLPFACKGGVCCTCRAKLTEGLVKMDVNYALEADEIAQGFILTCQSHPLTKKVVIDFDLR
ncbi:MAG: 1,2-phenylacetyl-CoA epoxidase subunit PaaE [Ferruginibacter sp.]